MYTMDISSSYMGSFNYDVSVNIYSDSVDLDHVISFIQNIEEVEDSVAVLTARGRISINQDVMSDYTRQNFDSIIESFKIENDQYILDAIIVTLDDKAFKDYTKQLNTNVNENEVIYVSEHNIRADVMHIFNMLDFSTDSLIKMHGYHDDRDYVELVVVGEVKKSPSGIQTPGVQPIFVTNEATYYTTLANSNMHANRYIYINSREPDIVEEKIREEFIEHHNTNMHIHNAAYFERTDRQMILLISIFVYGFITLITLIGITNIFNTISTNVELRRREFAMLRSVGLTKKGFTRILTYESVFYGFVALLFGLPASVGVSYLLFKAFGYIGSFSFTMPLKAVLICIFGVFALIFSTMIYSSRKLKKDNIVDAIRDENI